MAELPKYRPLGVGIASMPAVDFIATGRAQAGVYDALNRGLDVMSKYVTQKAEYEAAALGQKFGAENAPTQAQMDLAQQEGEDVSALLPGDDYTVYGRAARKTALDIVVDQSEMAARQELTALRLEAQTTDMSPTLFTQKINSLIDGYSENISALNPAAGSKFRAGLATVGNSALLAHSQAMADKAEKQEEVAALVAIDNIITSALPDVIQGGSTFNSDTGEFVSLTEKTQLQRKRIVQLGYAVADKSLVDSKLKVFDDALSAAKVGVVTDFVNQNPMANYDAVYFNKQISDPHVQDVLNNMTVDEIRAAKKVARDSLSKELSIEASIDTANERKRRNAAEGLLPSLQDAMQAGDEARIDGLISAMELLDPKMAYSTGNAIYSEGGVDKPEVVDNLRMLQSRGVLTLNDVNEARSNGHLGKTTYDDFLGVVSSQAEEDHADAMKIVKNKINPVPSIMPGKAERERNKQIGDIETKLIKARRKARKDQVPFDAIAFVENEISALSDTQYTPDEISAARAKVEQLRGLLGLDETANTTKLRTALATAAQDGNQRLLTDSADFNEALDILESTQ